MVTILPAYLEMPWGAGPLQIHQSPIHSSEPDEREEEQRLRDSRGRVKRACAVVVSTPRLAEILACDLRKANLFYIRNGVTETVFHLGALDGPNFHESGLSQPLRATAAISDMVGQVLNTSTAITNQQGYRNDRAQRARGPGRSGCDLGPA